MALIEFRTLGTLDLRRTDGSELHSLLAQPKRVGLLAYLCVASPRGFHRRDTLLGLFWPDADQAHARTSLRNALHVLRHSLGETALHSRGDEEVSVNFDAVWCDAVSFEEQIASEQVDGALALYRGDLLTGFFLEDVPVFERWLASERTRLRGSAARAARMAAERRESERNLTDAVQLARRAVDLTDTDERAVRRLVELLARVGDRAGALQAYEDFAQHLAAELGAEPSPDTRALVERLRASEAVSANVDEPHRNAVVETSPSGEPSVPGYSIGREIGRGGMAIVFLARDIKHDRPVAMKLLRPEIGAMLGTDRFLAEIALAARLHHPHILPLLDSGKANGLPFYIMPHVEGETLRSRMLREKFFPIEDAIRIACELADALTYAHGRGIIHRDVKPENILLENGHALVTDFGIARAVSKAGGERLTQTGLALGTAAYMSPEQADSAIELDARTDIYALACVLYEMLTGDPPFSGSTAQAVLARKAAEPAPPMRTVRDTIPASLERNVLKALSRVPADRFPTVSDFADAIKPPHRRDGDGLPGRKPTIVTRRWRPSAIQIVAISGAVMLLTVAILAFGTGATPESTVGVARQVTYSGRAFRPAISPDGQFLAYAVAEGDSQRVMVQDLASEGAPNTVAAITNATTLEWSPDGSQLLFGSFDGARRRGLAFTVPRTGGEKRGIGVASTMAANVWAHWIPDSLGGSSRVSLHIDSDTRLLILDLRTEDTVGMPVRGNYDSPFAGSWSPRGDLFAVAMKSIKPIQWVIGVVGRDGQLQIVVEDSVALGSPRWSPAGDAVYYARGTTSIWRVPVSAVTGKRTGSPAEVNRHLEILVRTFLHAPDFALTRNARRMAYASGRRYANIWMVRPGQSSAPILLTTGTALRWSPVVSPDGRWVAFAQEAAGSAELFRMPITGGPPERITFGARVQNPGSIAWSADGMSIAFGSVRGGRCQVWVAAVQGGQIRVLARTSLSPYTGHLTWAPGEEIAYLNSPHNHLDLVDPESGDVRTIVPSRQHSILQSPQYSPDGKKLAVAWNRGAGDFGVWTFEVTGFSPGKKIADGWLWPSGWSPDGRYVYANVYNAPSLYRLDTTGQRAPEVIVKPTIAWRGSQQNIPVREMQCTPAGRLQPDAYICAAFDFVSDIWIVDNFETPRD